MSHPPAAAFADSVTRSHAPDVARPRPRTRMRRATARLLPAVLPVTLGLVAGCQSPLSSSTRSGPSLAEVVDRAIAREVRSLAEMAEPREPDTPPAEAEDALAERRDELDAISPAMSPSPTPEDLGTDLAGDPQSVVELALDDAVRGAVRRNLSVQRVALQPAVNAEDVIEARSIFDAVVFGGATATITDQPAQVPTINGNPLGGPFNGSKSYRFETGVRKTFEAGTQLTLSGDITRTEDTAPGGVQLVPDPAYRGALRLGVVQPLLRGFGSDVNTASIRIAENARAGAELQLVAELLSLVDEVERAYFDLYVAWRVLEVREWLVRQGVAVRDVLERRRIFDTNDAQYADAVARVEQRRADVILARRNVRVASDQLKRLLDDDELSVGSEALVKPIGDLEAAALRFDLRDLVVTALEERPEIGQAALAIDDASIRLRVADNGRLPLLDLRGEVAWNSLDDDWGDAATSTLDDEFIDYVVGISFEQPWGNRGAEAAMRRSRLQRAQAVASYREAVRNVVFDVKSAIRDVVASFEVIQASRSSRIAQAENLRALLVEKEKLAGLTPEFLNLEFQRQESLAAARLQEVQAMSSYRQSLSRLDRATGKGLERWSVDVERVRSVAEDARYE